MIIMTTESEQNMPRKKKPADSGEKPAARRKKYAIAYRGRIARAEGQKPVRHRLSPLMVFWPENGCPDLVLQPGVNVVDASVWEWYTTTANGGSGAPQLMAKIERSQVEVLDGLPSNQFDLDALIELTIDADGLDWLERMEKRDDERQEVLEAIARQRAKANPVKIKQISYQGRNVVTPQRTASAPQMAMG